MVQLGRLQERIVATRRIPPRPARMAPIPARVPAELRSALQELGFAELYIHQAETFRRAMAGKHVVVTTGTASGKSLGFLLPVLKAVHEDPAARVLLLYPTKALAHDQLRGVLRIADALCGDRGLEAGVYDGDTPPAERRRLRERANLVLTNPDMLNAGLLPAHGRPGYAHLFRNVRYVVVDEMHVYRGAFGAHFSNLMRRLHRVCRIYGSDPQFLCSSATIANPAELAERLCHRPFSLVNEDGSPSPGKTVHFWQPPFEEDRTRRSVDRELAGLLPLLVKQRQKSIVFCRSRKQTEIVLKEARDHLRNVDGGHDEAALIGAYRGGYTPAERRQVEEDLIAGRLVGVVSTNALELGVDVGRLEVVLQAGFPGTRASFWQQLGRAGRRGAEAHGILVLAVNPVDQFIASDPDWLVGQPTEQAVVDPDNLTVQLAHVRAAAAELPLSLDDAASFPDLGEILPVLADAGELREVYGTWHWAGSAFPAGEFSLRSIDRDRFKVVDRTDGRTLTEMTRPQVYREAHPRAIYLHDGVEYQVEELDLVAHRAVVVPVAQNFYTQPDVRTNMEVLVTQEHAPFGLTEAWFGDVRVEDSVVGFKMLEFHNHQNLGYERLHQELSIRLDTEALWVRVPEAVLQVLGEKRRDALRGMVRALRAVTRLHTMAERSDLLGTTFPFVWEERDGETGEGMTCLVLYDHHPGGLGFAAKAFESVEELVRRALGLVRDCRCSDGCPACVGSGHLSRRLITWAFRRLFEEVPLPRDVVPPAPAPAPRAKPLGIAWEELPERWNELQQAVTGSRAQGAALLQRVGTVRLQGKTLLLELSSPGLASWLESKGPRASLRRLIARHVQVPPRWGLRGDVPEEAERAAHKRRHALRRRHEDLVRGTAESEREANAKLAAGFQLRTAEESGVGARS